MTAPEERLRQGLEHQKAGRLLEAAQAYSAVLREDPGSARAWHLLGTLEIERGNLDSALTLITKALSIGPESAAFHNNLAYIHGARGELALAETHYRRAIALEPRYAEAYHNLAGITQFKPGDPLLPAVEGLLARKRVSDEERCYLHFAAGKMCDDVGETDRAFEHYRKANAARGAVPNPRYATATLRSIAESFDAEFVKRRFGHGHPSEVPVFVVGMPRSGTSLVEQILASHPDMYGAGELTDIDGIARELARHVPDGTSYPACMPAVAPETLRGFADAYLRRITELAPQSARIVNKAPLDFRHLGLIALLFPRARVIHCRRNVLDTCLSCYFQNFAHGQEYSFDLAELGRFYCDYHALMQHWSDVLPLSILEVRYEDLVHDPEPVSREMLSHCGLEWDPACASFHATERTVRTASRWQVRQPIYESSVGRWRRYDAHLEPLRLALGPLAREQAQTPSRRRRAAGPERAAAPDAPSSAADEFNRAVTAHREGRLAEADAAYRRVLEAAPQHAEAVHHLGILAFQGQRTEEGLSLLRRSAELDPRNAFFQQNLAQALLRTNRFEAAEAAARRAGELDPRRLDAHTTRCDALVQLGRGREAEQAAQQALALQPNSPLAHSAQGFALLAQGELELAEEAFRRALTVKPDHPEAHNRLGVTLHKQRRFAEAEAAYRRAIAARPQFAEAHFNLASVLLLCGRLPEGFREYEWRWRNEQWAYARRDLAAPAWDGVPLDGRRILLHTEQGLGDAIQFARFAAPVAERGGHVILECPESLCSLFERLPGVSEVIARGSELPSFDCQAPLMSLPRILGTTLESIPAPSSYLAPDPKKVRRWRNRLGRHTRPRVGLVWGGNPKFPEDALRSPGLEAYRLLVEAEATQRFEFYSLQKGPARDALAASDLASRVVDLAEPLEDFSETAAAMACLDAVVSSCTAAAHLAGALGVPALTLVPRVPDWRWLLDRDDSPWYPSMRLFRQESPGDWAPTVEGVLARLGKLRPLRKRRA